MRLVKEALLDQKVSVDVNNVFTVGLSSHL